MGGKWAKRVDRPFQRPNGWEMGQTGGSAVSEAKWVGNGPNGQIGLFTGQMGGKGAKQADRPFHRPNGQERGQMGGSAFSQAKRAGKGPNGWRGIITGQMDGGVVGGTKGWLGEPKGGWGNQRVVGGTKGWLGEPEGSWGTKGWMKT